MEELVLGLVDIALVPWVILLLGSEPVVSVEAELGGIAGPRQVRLGRATDTRIIKANMRTFYQ